MNFPYPAFAALLLLVGLSLGLFSAPNTSAVMNSLPANQRGAGRRHAEHLPELGQRPLDRLLLHRHHAGPGGGPAPRPPTAGSPPRASRVQPAQQISHLSPIGSLFAAFLGINPDPPAARHHLLAQPAVHASYLTGRSFFPHLISGPFGQGLRLAFLAAAALCFIGAVFSWLRGGGQPEVHAFDRRGRRGGPGHRRRRGHGRGRRLTGTRGLRGRRTAPATRVAGPMTVP